MAFRFDHFNFNVMDLTKSIEFYRDAFGFEPVAEEHDEAGSYRIVFLGDVYKRQDEIQRFLSYGRLLSADD